MWVGKTCYKLDNFFVLLKKFFKFLSQNDVSKECDVDGPLEEDKDKYPTLISPL